jgi:hypothetical protein
MGDRLVKIFHGFRRFVVSELDANSTRHSSSRNRRCVVLATARMPLMCHVRFIILVMALSTVSSNSHAAGSFQKPPVREVVTAGVAPQLPNITLPNVSAHDLVGGCGRGRLRDQQTQGCRGPADIR